ncbi:MAG: hypothetical protein IJU19_03280 [Bacteroidales bacterium]|nr:hypothetical protein [Bacteroidales bacterium]
MIGEDLRLVRNQTGHYLTESDWMLGRGVKPYSSCRQNGGRVKVKESMAS